MDIIEIKKDSKKIEISKDTVIIALSIGIIIVSGIAIFLSVKGEHEEKIDNYQREIMRQYQKEARYIDNNINSNDAEFQNDQSIKTPTPVNISTNPVKTTPTSTPITNTPKK